MLRAFRRSTGALVEQQRCAHTHPLQVRRLSTSAPRTTEGGKIAVVTGASGCLGQAIALELGKHGCKVIAHYNSNADAADAVVSEIVAAGGAASKLQADLRDQQQVAAMFKQAAALYPQDSLQICVNNAGVIRDSLALKMKPEDWREVLELNLTAAFFCSQAAFAHMMRQRSGRIVNISSIVGQMGNPGQASYAAAKGGMIAMTRSLAKEFAKRNVCVNVVCPGYIESAMTASLPNLEELVQSVPLGRLGTPGEVAGLVRFLALDPAAAYITGHSFNVDGGAAIGSS
jgi:3-oxoacyl-[acyl-carrier protein] reductase